MKPRPKRQPMSFLRATASPDQVAPVSAPTPPEVVRAYLEGCWPEYRTFHEIAEATGLLPSRVNSALYNRLLPMGTVETKKPRARGRTTGQSYRACKEPL